MNGTSRHANCARGRDLVALVQLARCDDVEGICALLTARHSQKSVSIGWGGLPTVGSWHHDDCLSVAVPPDSSNNIKSFEALRGSRSILDRVVRPLSEIEL